MLWGLIGKVRAGSEDHPEPQALNAEIKAAAQRIDAYYDSLLNVGLPMELAVRIEQQRIAAHAELRRQALATALDGWHGPGRMG